MDKPQLNINNEFDGINITKLFQVIVQRKWVVVLCLLLTVLIFVFYSLTLKPLFESVAVIQIGGISTPPVLISDNEEITRPIEDPVKLSQWLKTTKKISVTLEKFNNVSTNILTLTSNSNDPYKAQASLKKITDELIRRHDLLLNESLIYKKVQINSLKRQLNSVQLQQDFCQKELLQLRQIDSFKMWLNMEKMRLTESQFELERQIKEQELLLSDLYVSPTHVLKKPSLILKPVKPNWLLNIQLSLLLGITFGVFAALIIEKVSLERINNKN